MAAWLTKILKKSLLTQLDDSSLKAAAEWEQFCEKLFRAYQTIALEEVEPSKMVAALRF